MADLQCLPGMEGAAVLTEAGDLVGMLTCPLSHTTFDAEVIHRGFDQGNPSCNIALIRQAPTYEVLFLL